MGSDAIYCLECGYDLTGLPEPRCPECGTAFDPADPMTYRNTPYSVWRVPLWLPIGALCYPLIPGLMLWATWVAAGLQLGHTPVPMVDDPKRLTGVASALYVFTFVTLTGLVYWFPAMLILSAAHALKGRRHDRVSWAIVALLGCFLTLGAGFIFIRSTMGNWFFD